MQLSPQVAIKDKDWSYIRRKADGRDKLFQLRDDPREMHDLINDPTMHAVLERMRAACDRLIGSP